MQGGIEKTEIVKTQNNIQENFSKIKTMPYEMGTCKRVFKLPNQTFGLAVTHSNSLMERDLIHDEHVYLSYLKEHQYPVVGLHGKVFPVEGEGEKTRYGFLMDYIANAVFIEVKSPALLKAQIFAALLDMPTRPSEGWWGLNHAKLLQQMGVKLNSPDTLEKLQKLATILQQNFMNLIEKLEKDQLGISDLQIMLGNNGSLTIIDPLDVVKMNLKEKKLVSILHPEKPASLGFIEFMVRTNEWLNQAAGICNMIATTNAVNLKALLLTQGDHYPIPPHKNLSFTQGKPKSETKPSEDTKSIPSSKFTPT